MTEPKPNVAKWPLHRPTWTEPAPLVYRCKDPAHGDYTTNIALVLAAKAKNASLDR